MRLLAQVVFLALIGVAFGCSSSDEPLAPPTPPPPNANLWVHAGYDSSECYVEGPDMLATGQKYQIDSTWFVAGVYVKHGEPFTITQTFSQNAANRFGGAYACYFGGFLRLDDFTEFQGDGCHTSSIPSDPLGLTCVATWSGVAP